MYGYGSPLPLSDTAATKYPQQQKLKPTYHEGISIINHLIGAGAITAQQSAAFQPSISSSVLEMGEAGLPGFNIIYPCACVTHVFDQLQFIWSAFMYSQQSNA